LAFITCQSQDELADLPEPVSNNAVVAVNTPEGQFVYSFGGIGTEKQFDDIHKKTFKYDVKEDRWTQLEDLPSGNGRIAAGASVVDGLIYIIGGYEVFSNGNERSFRKVHVFDPESDQFLEDAAPLPKAIDDHIQVVWRDSLIYVVTGWSNVTNVADVQIFDPKSNSWSTGTPVPGSIAYKVFGGSGAILNDTIYYAGGASAVRNFPPSPYLRKGIINPADATEIQWSAEETDHALGYRMACSVSGDAITWFGGSSTTYNFNGIAYNGSGGVDPSIQIRQFYPISQTWGNFNNVFPQLMDLRGIGKLDDHNFVVAGGMTKDQLVSDKTYLIQLNFIATTTLPESEISISPNPSSSDKIRIKVSGKYTASVFNMSGQKIDSWIHFNESLFDPSSYQTGTFCLILKNKQRTLTEYIVRL
jgi:hypothetical protein